MNLIRQFVISTTFLGVFLTSAVLTGSVAEARPNTKDFSCAGVRAYVRDRGTVVMNTKNSNVYRKFYAPHRQCPFPTVHTRHSVPTKSGICRLFICREARKPMFKLFN